MFTNFLENHAVNPSHFKIYLRKDKMQSSNHGLNSRSSSASSSAPEQSNVQDGVSDDIVIAQELLHNSKVLRESSLTTTSAGPPTFNDASFRVESSKPSSTGRRRQKARTSRTWTSSSGDVPQHNDIEDRAAYINEYNLLAKKVWKVARTTRT